MTYHAGETRIITLFTIGPCYGNLQALKPIPGCGIFAEMPSQGLHEGCPLMAIFSICNIPPKP